MVPLLVQLGLALAGGVIQKVASDKQHEKDLAKFNRDGTRDILNKRAARAGDSMYMQDALARQEHRPEAPPSPFPGVVAGMGSALLGYNGGIGSDSEPPTRAADSGTSLPSRYAGGDWDDLKDKWGGYA